jgi:hypothetical protein
MKSMTATEGCQEQIVEIPNSDLLKDCAEDASQPSLEACTEYDSASVDSSLHSALYESDASLSSKVLKRRVSFSKIEIREYSVTIGDHPLCQDGLPLSLDWEHSESTEVNMSCSRERTEKYQMPRRMTYQEKRDRIIATKDLSDENVRNKELGQVIERMQCWWQKHPILPMPNLGDIAEEPKGFDGEGDRVFEIEPPKLNEYEMEWRRNSFRRSTSFQE